LKGYAAFSDLDKPMTDITDGWGWRAVQAGLERRRNGKWEIKDVDVHELKLQFVALPNGLILQINIDWYIFMNILSTLLTCSLGSKQSKQAVIQRVPCTEPSAITHAAYGIFVKRLF
jgi:hypothetical protein